MAEEAPDDGEFSGEDGDAGPKKLSGKKLVLFIVLPLLLLIGVGVGVTVMLGLFGGDPPPPVEQAADGHAPPPQAAPEPSAQSIFFEVPDLIVNLNTKGRKSTFLKIKISLEIENAADIDVINQMLPRIVDNFQVYLRELRTQDLQGSAGMYRLREELLRRVNLAVRPARVRDVLFKEMLVQ
ncbi:MAG: flagellar basal body protein FliL [Rhodospirillaceae bacterium]|jgi:flagellar protein FliL|nr:flagellar basal body protein FliL [Rhodospirillaceae bacterium]